MPSSDGARILQTPLDSLSAKIRKGGPLGGNEWWKFNDYDYSMRQDGSAMDMFEVIPIEMSEGQDSIMVKVEMDASKHALGFGPAQLELTLSGSEIQYLQPGQTVSGHVSNFEHTYKIYELHVNRDQLNYLNASDLIVEVTPCNGRVTFFVSNDHMSLFKPASEAKSNTFLDVLT
jgi:hypothetical protein